MTKEFRDFLKKANEDPAVFKKMEALQNETDHQKVMEQTIAIAKAEGFALTPADFEAGEGEMDDAEMRAVSGGWCKCVCVAGGGGKEDADGATCVCAVAGVGLRKDNDGSRCICPMVGYGYDANIPPCELMG